MLREQMTSAERLKAIELKRQAQPISELERKWNKAKGRHSTRYWAQECLDLGAARGRELYDYFNSVEKAHYFREY